MPPPAMIAGSDLEGAAATLRRIERQWVRAADLIERSSLFAA
jgi:hypothetical protein